MTRRCCPDPDRHWDGPCPWTPGATVIAWVHRARTHHVGIVAAPPGRTCTDPPGTVWAIERPTGTWWMLPPGMATVLEDPSGTHTPGGTL